MILGTLFLSGAVLLLALAWRALRQAAGADRVGAPGARIVLEASPGQAAPRLRVEAGGVVVFGPFAAEWAPRPALAKALGNHDAAVGRLGGPVAAGGYRVRALVDLSAQDALGSGEPRLDRRLREALGGMAMLLEPVEGGGPPILLHGAPGHAAGSIGGIALGQAHYAALVARLGNPEGLAVEILRRRIERSGWGGETARRRRPR